MRFAAALRNIYATSVRFAARDAPAVRWTSPQPIKILDTDQQLVFI
jgi:hypothetical protein